MWWNTNIKQQAHNLEVSFDTSGPAVRLYVDMTNMNVKIHNQQKKKERK